MRKNRFIRMLIVFVNAIIIIFTVVSLGACNTKPTLLQRLDTLSLQVQYAQNGGRLSTIDIDVLLEKLADLRADVKRLDVENLIFLERITDYESYLKVLRTKDNIKRQWVDSECGRFSLYISVEETTLRQGDNFVVNVALRNNSEKSIYIDQNISVIPHIQGYEELIVGSMPPIPHFVRFDSLEEKSFTISSNHYFPNAIGLGYHDLTVQLGISVLNLQQIYEVLGVTPQYFVLNQCVTWLPKLSQLTQTIWLTSNFVMLEIA